MYPSLQPDPHPGAAPVPAATRDPAAVRDPVHPRPTGARGTIAAILAAALLSAGLASTATSIIDRATTSGGSTASATASESVGSATTVAAATATGSVASAAAEVSPAVVTITASAAAQGAAAQGGPFGSSGGVGSGFIYDADGWILTNAHVVEGASTLTVTLADGRSFEGTVVASDAASDLAVVKVDASGLPAAALGSSASLTVGSPVIAIGTPLGEYAGTVTIGVVSGTQRDITVADEATRTTRDMTGLLQTDAAVNEGSSGGPLANLAGDVVGIVTAGSTATEGIGFAIPIDDAAAILAEAGGSTLQG